MKKEFDLLDDSARVFKLNGPVLVKQDVSEAKVTVINRLKFFQAEMLEEHTHTHTHTMTQ